ncbi:alpha/beta fold hydrolase [Methylocella sp.]|uniref:alpha/beta fold hydrolase n=1 Tax=Methylocella sp. TaxID=1978226 RepID=UPI00378518C3
MEKTNGLSRDATLDGDAYAGRFIQSRDGLSLFMREYGSRDDPGLPVICLPGLTRNSADFDPLARALAGGAAGGRRRRVLAVDYRGRGRSDHDPDWRKYSLPVESEDISCALESADIHHAVFIGTSRGGLHAMLFAATRPNFVSAVVLNDIGPVIERSGLDRIKGYAGKYPPPRTISEATGFLKRIMGEQFEVPEEVWRAYALMTFADEHGEIGPRYDPNVSQSFAVFDANSPPDLWPLFEKLSIAPLLVLRGENSDILSAETAEDMTRRHPDARLFIVPRQGHAPLLMDEPTIREIADFVSGVENGARAS